jgi:hypothetical protein
MNMRSSSHAAASDLRGPSLSGTLKGRAGGRGRLLATILEHNPHLRDILFDLPNVIEDARELVNDSGVVDRCKFVSGNFFEAVPDGGDAYILRNIIHDWEDDQNVARSTTR